MSRPLCHFLPAACAAISLGFTACVGTVYDPMYSNRNTHYKPPAAKKEASAEAILEATTPPQPGGAGMPVDSSSALPPPADIPGLSPAGDAAGGAMTPPPLPPAN